MWYIILFVITLLIDQVSKIIVDTNDYDFTVIKGVLNINSEHNPGASFSFLANVSWAQTFFIVLTTVVLLGGIAYLIFGKYEGKWIKSTIALLFSGTIGNYIDRIAFGYVRDFIDVPFFANFNIADSCLVVGAFMLVFYVLFLDADPVFSCFKKRRELKKQGGQQAESSTQALGEDKKAVQFDDVENLDD